MFPKPYRLFLLAFLCSTLAFAQRGAVTRPETLSSLTAQAHTIVEGRILDSRVEPHPQYPNLSTVLVTMSVAQTLKGPSAPSLTFRQFVWDIRDRLDHVGYTPGTEVLLFLSTPTNTGLRSPIGLEQGHFTITTDRKGNRLATNGRNNLGLAPTTAPQSRTTAKTSAAPAAKSPQNQGPMLEKDLVRQIKSLVATH